MDIVIVDAGHTDLIFVGCVFLFLAGDDACDLCSVASKWIRMKRMSPHANSSLSCKQLIPGIRSIPKLRITGPSDSRSFAETFSPVHDGQLIMSVIMPLARSPAGMIRF